MFFSDVNFGLLIVLRPEGGILCIFLDPARTRCVSTVCVFFTLNRSFYFLLVDIQAHPVSTLILRPREIQALRSQNYDTKMLHHNAVKGVDDALPCHRTGIDRHNIRKLATQIN